MGALVDACLIIAPTVQAIEMEMLDNITQMLGVHRGAATWLSKGLKIEEAQISLRKDIRRVGSRGTGLQRLALARRADRLATEIAGFFAKASAFIPYEDDEEVLSDIQDVESIVGDEDIVDNLSDKRPDRVKLPLPYIAVANLP